MVSPARAAFDRLGPWPAFAAFATVGCAAWASALASLVPLARAIGDRVPLVELAPYDGVGLPIGLSAFAFAAMTLTSPPDSVGGRRRSARRSNGRRGPDWPVVWLWVAAAGLALSLLAGTVAQLVVGEVVTRRGYVACPPIGGEHRTRLRWVRAVTGGAGCPVDRLRPA